jgi:transposase
MAFSDERRPQPATRPRHRILGNRAVPWARPGARHTRDVEDMVAWCARGMDKTTVARLLRVSWEAVARIVVRVVASSIDDARLDHLYRIGVDEIAYRKEHRYLTVVADHDRDGAVVWAAEGKNAATLRGFFAEVGEERISILEAITLDMGAAYIKAVKDAKRLLGLRATVVFDPFHVVRLANEAIDKARRWAWNEARHRGDTGARWVKRTRWALVKDPGRLTTSQRLTLEELRTAGSVLYRAWQLKAGTTGGVPDGRVRGRRLGPVPGPVAGLGLPVPHPLVRQTLQDHPQAPRGDPRGH